MKVAFNIPMDAKMIEVDYIHGGVKYKKIMPNPKDNGLLAIALGKDPRKIEMKNVRDVRAFVPHVQVS